MKLYNIIDKVKQVAKLQRNVNSVYVGDVYMLNELEDVKFSTVIINEQSHKIDTVNGKIIYTINLFYIDRQTAKKDNVIDIHSHSVDALRGILEAVEGDGLMVANDYRITTFEERFQQVCAGAYVTADLSIGLDECSNLYEIPESQIKGLQFMAVIGDMEIWLREYGTFSVGNTPTLEYTYNGKVWLDWNYKSKGLKVKNGNSVWVRSKTLFRGTVSGWSTNYRNFDFIGDGMIMCYGYIDYLHGENFENTIYGGDYAQLFKDNKKILKAPDIAVTDYTGSARYYQFQDMFAGCSSMVYGPKEIRCNVPKSFMWTRMFDGCTALLETPKLIIEYNENTSDSPGSNLCINMFRNCTALRKINWDIKFNNVLRPTTMNYFQGMFQNCTSLVECDFTLDNIRFVDQNAFQSMFEGCTALAKAPEFADHYNIRDNTPQQFYRMFFGCTALTVVPKIISVSNANKNALTQMFEGCTALVNGVERIDVDYIGVGACQRMFYGCTNLKNAAEISATQIGTQGCEYMYYNCTALTDVPDELPATTVEGAGYRYMFYFCKALEKTPHIKVTDLTNGTAHLYQMFYGCTALTDVQDKLYPMTLTTNCYYQMFDGCTALTKSPELPATVGVSGCYSYMFRATKVNRIKCLLAGNVGTSYTTNWVNGVSGTIRDGIFIKNSNSTWAAAGVNSIPVGWTVLNDGAVNIELDQNSQTFDDALDGLVADTIIINYAMPVVNRSMGLCLPFDLSNDELTELFGTGYGLVTYDSFTMSINPDDTPNIQLGPVKDNTELHAGVPYCVQPRKTVNSIVVHDKKIQTKLNDNVLTNGNYRLTFSGDFVKRTITAPPASTHVYNYSLSDGVWRRPQTDLPLNGYRIYLKAEEINANNNQTNAPVRTLFKTTVKANNNTNILNDLPTDFLTFLTLNGLENEYIIYTQNTQNKD